MTDLDFDEVAYRHNLGSFLTGVTVVTTLNDKGEPIGFTANSFTSVSLDPPLIIACLAKSSFLYRTFSQCSHFAVNILSDHQTELSMLFASPERDRFRHTHWREEHTGSPVIDGVVAWLDCETDKVIDAGDHVILMGKVLTFDSSSESPLGYLRGNYVQLALQQEVTIALQKPGQDVLIGAIVEWQGQIFLMDDHNNKNTLCLPEAKRLGNKKELNSLTGMLGSLGLYPQANYLYAVYEDKHSHTNQIFYRGEVKEKMDSDVGRFYSFVDIPFERISDSAIKAMLHRYISERSQDSFGIYFGDQVRGVVEPITNDNEVTQ